MLNKRLLEESVEAYYWVGFLLADGHFSKYGEQIEVSQCLPDKERIEKFVTFIESNNKISIFQDKGNFSTPNSITVRVKVCGKGIVKQISEKFNITHNKTYHPPKINWHQMDDDLFTALFIGFIDGDGTVFNKKNKQTDVKVCIHEIWEPTLNIWKNRFEKLLNISCPAPYKREYMPNKVTWAVGNFAFSSYLKDFILKHKLQVMKRKWDNVLSSSEKTIQYIRQEEYDLACQLRNYGYSHKDIANQLNRSPKVICNMLNDKNRTNKYKTYQDRQKTALGELL